MDGKNENPEIEKYVNAVERALEEAPLRKDDSVDVSDLWVITSLPIDLISECLKDEKIEIPSHIKKITNRKRVILKNEKYVPEQNKKDEL